MTFCFDSVDEVTRLTKKVFGVEGDVILHGAVEAFSCNSDGTLTGHCLCDYSTKKYYTHPTLFSDLPLNEYTCETMQVWIEDGQLARQERGPYDYEPHGKIRHASPLRY